MPKNSPKTKNRKTESPKYKMYLQGLPPTKGNKIKQPTKPQHLYILRIMIKNNGHHGGLCISLSKYFWQFQGKFSLYCWIENFPASSVSALYYTVKTDVVYDKKNLALSSLSWASLLWSVWKLNTGSLHTPKWYVSGRK